jgi:hypothetical protein
MLDKFILKSADLGDDIPRVCTVISRPEGRRENSGYLLVEISPVLRTTFWDEPERDFDRLLLALVEPDAGDDIGKQHVVADIVLCPHYSGGPVDESACARIGMGSLYPATN